MSAVRRSLGTDPRQSLLLLGSLGALALAASSEGLMLLVVALIGAAGLLSLCMVRPDRAILALVALLPFQMVILALLYRLGVPAGAVRLLTFWKEGVILGVGLAALLRLRADRYRLDLLDGLALGLVGFVAIYFLFPSITDFGVQAANANERLLSLRTGTGYLVLFLAVRRLELDRRVRSTFETIVARATVLMAAVTVIEWGMRPLWRTVTFDLLGVQRYRTDILRLSTSPDRLFNLGGGSDRYGSLLYSPLALSFFLLLGWGVLVARFRRGAQPRVVVAMGVVAVGLVLTGTRSAMLAAALVLLLPVVRIRRPARLGVGLGVVVLVVFAVATALSTGAIDRFGDEGAKSTAAHGDRPLRALAFVIDHPLGVGLGGTSGDGRFETESSQSVTAENSYLQVGAEYGLVPMVLFVSLVLLTIRRLRGRARRDPLDEAWATSFVALALMALVLQVFLDLVVSSIVWTAVAMVLGGRPANHSDRSQATAAGAPSVRSPGRLAQTPRGR